MNGESVGAGPARERAAANGRRRRHTAPGPGTARSRVSVIRVGTGGALSPVAESSQSGILLDGFGRRLRGSADPNNHLGLMTVVRTII